MRKIKRKTGHIWVMESGEECPSGEICFLSDEWQWAQRLAANLGSDPESLKAFWETCFERKTTIPGYVLFMDFPKEAPAPIAPELPKPLPTHTEAAAMAQQYGGSILEMLRGRKPNV